MAKQNKFGTFGGVFVPSILTILGVIMYLRLPMIVGEAGLWATIGIIIIAHIISVTTGLSVSSIATDKKVEAGGTYYMISRSLGLPIGGTLGLALFVGLSFSVSLYLIGFSESFLNYWGFSNNINNIRLTGTIILLVVTTVTFISTSLAIKTQYFIMAAILLSLISIFVGQHDYTPTQALISDSTSSAVPFMVLFGIFFPAVTGFEAGVSMSGDLKDPKKSIPGGSIMAIAVGFVVYIGLAFFFSYTVSGEALANDPQILLNISWIPELVIAGIWGATLSSALGSILGAPRILQATAVDRITPKVFSKGYGPTNEPRNALLLTFVIAEAGILIGELDIIARIVSIFFITTYGFLNISAAFERWSSADFRPEFKIPGWISILGAAACILVMIQLDFIAMLGAIFILGMLFLYLKRKELSLESGDAWSGVWASLVKTGITNLKRVKLHKRNWRPNIIMFSGDEKSRAHLYEMGKSISGKLGILSAFELIESQNELLSKKESNLHEQKDESGYFEHKLYCDDIYNGMDQIARVYGFSGVEPNTVMMGWSKNPKNREKFIQFTEKLDRYNFNSILLNYKTEKKFGNYKQIDIWWSGAGRNLTLAINLIRNINYSTIWKDTKVRINIINQENSEAENIYKATSAILNNHRFQAEVRVINNQIDGLSTKEIISVESKNSDLTIVGIPNQRFRQMHKYFDELNEILEVCGTAMVINASDDFESMEVISPAHSKSKSEVLGAKELDLPALIPSPFPEISKDVEKIDLNGLKTLNAVYSKLIQPIMSNRINLINELENRLVAIEKELSSIEQIPDAYRRKKAIDKLKNTTFYKIDSFIEEKTKSKTLLEETSKIEETVDWYLKRLQSDFERFPSKLTIAFERSQFSVDSEDNLAIKIYKRTKLFNNWLFGGKIQHTIQFREVARFYQLNNRKVFFNHYLDQFGNEEEQFYQKLRKIIDSIIHVIDDVELEKKSNNPNSNGESLLEDLIKRVKNEAIYQTDLLTIYNGRLQLEFRRNVQLMSDELQRINIDQLIRKSRKPAKFYTDINVNTLQFAEERNLRVKTYLNMILLGLSVNSAKNRLHELNVLFGNSLKELVNKKYIQSLDKIASKISQNKGKTELRKITLNDNFKNDLQELLSENITKMVIFTEKMPETIDIYSFQLSEKDSKETLEIPVAKMTEYYLKAQYEVYVEEHFEKLLDTLKISVYSIKDLLNLTLFNLENVEADTTEEGSFQFVELNDKIVKEKEKITTAINEFIAFTEHQFEQAFDPLSPLKIEESASEFVSRLRNYQGKQVLSGINKVTDWMKTTAIDLTTKLYYSKSEGILLAMKLNKAKDLSSTNSLLLDLKEKVSPTKEIINVLPPYYVTLFNGKSNIGLDFWISRPIEEKMFTKAANRYKQGFGGGILLLGERNSGKTAFSRHMTQQIKSPAVYSIFPPVQGDITESCFNEALCKGTQMNGDTDQILSALPHDSTLIINDLELFWERSQSGQDLITLLTQLIDEYGHRILFVVNMNPYAYRVINQVTNLADRFIEIINFTPFDAEDIKELIMKRHRSSGLTIGYNKEIRSLNEIQLARHFDSYFSYSSGNPGTALNGWLANIKMNLPDGLIVNKPESPPLEGLENVTDEWLMVLTQFILHKRLTQEKLERICQWEPREVKSQLLAMIRAGLVHEKGPSIYHINPYVHPFVVKVLKEREAL